MDREISRGYNPFTGAFDPAFPSADRASTERPLSCVVAIPVKNEAERLRACLAALADQRDRLGRPTKPDGFEIVVFANNCTDGSGRLARALGDELSLALRVVEVSLLPGAAHAGNARRAAMDAALDWLAEDGATDGVIMTTDADSRVSPSWIVQQFRGDPRRSRPGPRSNPPRRRWRPAAGGASPPRSIGERIRGAAHRT